MGYAQRAIDENTIKVFLICTDLVKEKLKALYLYSIKDGAYEFPENKESRYYKICRSISKNSLRLIPDMFSDLILKYSKNKWFICDWKNNKIPVLARKRIFRMSVKFDSIHLSDDVCNAYGIKKKNS